MEGDVEDIKERLLKSFHSVSSIKIIPCIFVLIILTGALLLMLPVSQKQGGTGFTDALFTATSATCVTGLIRFDTYTHWTVFGQLVILTMIQIGGIGFMTIAIWLMSLTSHKIGLNTRFIMQNSISAPSVGGMVRITRFILCGTFLIEGIGAFLLTFIFVPRFGLGRGIYFSIFHSISAFCNAGFDLMGIEEQYSSLTLMGSNVYLNLIIMSLIVIGGLGFFVWKDFLDARFRFKKFKLHTKLVVFVTAFLIVSGAVILFILEYHSPGEGNKSIGEQIINAFFQSVTVRTAGFNTVDLAAMEESSSFLMIVLMLIGGSPGSTAGGIKTTTFAVLMISILSVFKRKKTEEAFGRRMDEGIMRTSACVFMTYLILMSTFAMIISKIEGLPMMTTLFESASAIGTVGLTMGITPEVGMVSKMLLIILMYVGRVGSITILMAFSSERRMIASKLPLEQVQIG